MNRIGNTREQIMQRAEMLLLQKGFNGFSYRDISTPMGVKNAAIHYHFPTKSDLAKALVNQYHDTLRSETASFMAYGGPALPQIEGLFSFSLRQSNCGNSLCPVGALTVDYDDLPEEIRKATHDLHHDTVKWLVKVLETGREQDEFQFQGDAEPRALTIMAALQGARQIARIRGDQTLPAVIEQIRVELDITT
jgi:AcrR family transcriptional regulator